MIQAITLLILLLLVILAFQTLKKPGIAAALVWSMIVLESVVQQGNPFLLRHAKFMNYLVGCLAAAAAVWAILNQKFKKTPIPLQVWLYGFLIGYCMISVVWSVSPAYTTARMKLALPYIVAFGFLAPLCIYDEKQLAAAIKTTIYFGGIVVLANVISRSGSRGIVLDDSGGKVVEANPLAAASYAAYVAIACLFSIWGKKLASPLSILKIGIILLCLINIIKSGSRGQLIAFFVVSMFWLPIMTKASVKRSIISSFIALVSASIFVVVAAYFIQILGWSNRWDFQQLVDDGQARLDAAIFMIKTNYQAGPLHWFFGLGTSSSFKYLSTYPHNIYLETIAEEGIVGVILLISILWLSLKQGLQMMQSGKLSSSARENAAILVAMFSFNLILASKQGSLINSASSVFCMALTIAWMHARLSKQMKGSQKLQYYWQSPPHYGINGNILPGSQR